jgi:hypothetical protein
MEDVHQAPAKVITEDGFPIERPEANQSQVADHLKII